MVVLKYPCTLVGFIQAALLSAIGTSVWGSFVFLNMDEEAFYLFHRCLGLPKDGWKERGGTCLES
jgi:hypothetical protein